MRGRPIVALGVVRDEAVLIEDTVRHLFAHEVDRVIIMDHGSTDATPAILARLAQETGRVDVVRNDAPYFRQEQFRTVLLRRVARLRPSWVIPFDADEVWVPLHRATLGRELRALGTGIVHADLYRYWGLDRRERKKCGPGKQAFSFVPGAVISIGSHRIRKHPGPVHARCAVVYERHYVSEDYFVAKALKYKATWPPERVRGGSSYFGLNHYDEGQLRALFRHKYASTPMVDAAIPLARTTADAEHFWRTRPRRRK